MIRRLLPGVLAALALLAACTSSGTASPSASAPPSSSSVTGSSSGASSSSPAPRRTDLSISNTLETDDGTFTVSFAGDVHFAGRVAKRLASPSTIFGAARPGLTAADLTMVNLETAITTGGTAQAKLFTFRAPPAALTALKDSGVDLATMANNHGADYGAVGVQDSLRAIQQTGMPVIGIGKDAAAAFAPYTTTLHGARVAIFAADQVQDETTLRLFSAGPSTAGVANAFSSRLVRAVKRAKAAGYVVIVYLHWGIEYHTCPSDLQTSLATTLADAGASAVVGTHAHVLQGAGWRRNGTYVAYGLGNYLWWVSFGNDQDDNGVLTLTFHGSHVIADRFAPSHLDSRGVPLPATGAEGARILHEWNADRGCTGLSATPPR